MLFSVGASVDMWLHRGCMCLTACLCAWVCVWLCARARARVQVKLCSVGYYKFADLARKFRSLYTLCVEQLSKQKHYDFGLRNVLAVLRSAGVCVGCPHAQRHTRFSACAPCRWLRGHRRTCGGRAWRRWLGWLLLRAPRVRSVACVHARCCVRVAGKVKLARPDANEDELVMSSLRDMNLAKLVPGDVPVFLSLLADIFPSVAAVPAVVTTGLREALVTVAAAMKVRGRGPAPQPEHVDTAVLLRTAQLPRVVLARLAPLAPCNCHARALAGRGRRVRAPRPCACVRVSGGGWLRDVSSCRRPKRGCPSARSCTTRCWCGTGS